MYHFQQKVNITYRQYIMNGCSHVYIKRDETMGPYAAHPDTGTNVNLGCRIK